MSDFGLIVIGLGLGVGLSCIGDGIKNLAKVLEKRVLDKPNTLSEENKGKSGETHPH